MNAESWLLGWPGWLLQSIESIDPQQHGFFAQEVLAEAHVGRGRGRLERPRSSLLCN